MSTISAAEFDRDVSAAKRAALAGPVVITDRGRASFVLLSIADYEELRGDRTIVDSLRSLDDTDFEPGRLRDLPRAADL